MSFLFSARRHGRAPLFSLTGCVAVLAASLTLAAPALAADALSLAEAQRLAVERSRQIRAQDAAATASREMAAAAGRLPDPVLKIGVDNLPVSGPDRGSLTADFMTMRRIGVMQEITRSDKRAFRAERYQREADKELAEKDKTTADVERETAVAWLDRYYAEAMASVIVSQRDQAQREREAADAAYRAGRGSQADVLSARAAVAQFDDRVDDAARRVLSKHSLGPDYRLPGLPHRAGHGLGLQIHEEPYIVRGNAIPLAAGMCFSNEPMIVFPDKFGIRLEDHIYMTADGPHWFTNPAKGPTEPFS